MTISTQNAGFTCRCTVPLTTNAHTHKTAITHVPINRRSLASHISLVFGTAMHCQPPVILLTGSAYAATVLATAHWNALDRAGAARAGGLA
jgi:hypothetical protein